MLRKKLWHFLLSCWGATPKPGEHQAAAFRSDHASSPNTAYNISSARHLWLRPGLHYKRRRHRKWKLELFTSGSIRTVGKQGSIFSRKTKPSKLIQQRFSKWAELMQFSPSPKWSFLVYQRQQLEAKDINASVLCKLNFSLKTFWHTAPNELKFCTSYNCLKEVAILACWKAI